MRFAIYDAVTDGNTLWSEVNPAVQVSGGLFSVLLGSIVNLPGNIFDSPDRYFGVKVGADDEMSPRQRIAGVASARVAENGVPPGGVIMWSGSVASIPAGWALCDGTNGTPDLSGRFVVGVGSGPGIAGRGGPYSVSDAGGEASHKLTGGEMPSHTHQLRDYGIAGVQQIPSGAYHAVFIHGDFQTNPAGGDLPHENRPPYYALCYIMKLPY